jgi:hypothetical protein
LEFGLGHWGEFERFRWHQVDRVERVYTLGNVGRETAEEVGVRRRKGSAAEREGCDQSVNLAFNNNRGGKSGLHFPGKILREDKPGLSETLTANALAGLNHYTYFGGKAERGSAEKFVAFAQSDCNPVGRGGFVREVSDLFQLVGEDSGTLNGDEVAARNFPYGGSRFLGRRRFGEGASARVTDWFGTHKNNSTERCVNLEMPSLTRSANERSLADSV